jgi:hypothetical protein
MHNQEYFILSANGKEWIKIDKVTPVSNEWEIDLFLHPAQHGTGRRHRTDYKWTVTEGETGAAFAHGNTSKEAIANALKEVQERGIEKVLKTIAGLLMQYGHSPRYPKAA